MRPLVSIVVVAYRVREPLLECLQSIAIATEKLEQWLAANPPAAEDTPPGGEAGGALTQTELIVVDNGDLSDLVRERCPQARVLKPNRNLGFAGGVQLGIATATGSWIALVNDDATLAPEALVRMVERGLSDPRVGSVAAQIRFEQERDLINSAGIELDSLGIATERLAGEPLDRARQPCGVFGASGCVALYRADMLREIGGFDSDFFAYLEDVDVAWRAQAAGWRAAYEPAAVAHHRGSASSGEGSARKYHLVGRNRVRLLARNATGHQLARGAPAILCYDAAYVIYVAITDRTLAPLYGRIAGLRRWRAVRRQAAPGRREVALSSPWSGWRRSLRQHRAYRRAGS